MDIGSLLLILALLIPVVLFIARPFIEQRATAVTAEEHDYSALLAERDRILDALQELDFDHTLGKIPDSDYEAQRTRLMRAGADILRQIDEYAGRTAEETPANDRLEAAVAERKAAAEPARADDELEALIAARRRAKITSGKAKGAGFCPQCGSPVYEGDRFCPKCGHAVE
jgi:rubrerythrin